MNATAATPFVPDIDRFLKAKPTPEVVVIPPAMYLTIDGSGAPEGEAFQQAIGALYSVAYPLKMAIRKAGTDYKVGALEGLWWVELPGGGVFSWSTERDLWHWKLLMRVPDFVTQGQVVAERARAAAKKGGRCGDVNLERIDEGKSVQMMHIGPFATEPADIEAMHTLIAAQGSKPRGRHHEIYLSDFRRTAPERLRTVLRQPME